MKYFLSIVVFLSIMSGCHKKGHFSFIAKKVDCNFNFTEPAINEDTFFTMGCPVMFRTIFLNKYNYSDPVFNPNNKDEIAYIREDMEIGTGWNNELWVFNFCTGETRYLTDKIGYDPCWSVKNWIIFTGKNYQIWKIKSNGDSLTQLTNQSGFNNHPKWNDEGDKFIFRADGNKSLFLIADESGINIDTLPVFAGRWNWHKNYILYARSWQGKEVYGIYNLDSKEFSFVGDAPNNRMVGDLNFIESKNSILYNEKVVGYTNIDTKEEVILLKDAANRSYGRMDLSDDDQTIILTRTYMNKLSECEMETETSLYLIDIDGKNERRINIPE